MALAVAAPCGDRSPCREVERFPAGSAGTVVHVVLHDETDLANAHLPTYGAPGACNPHEYWLVGPKREERLLLRLCNDGYGASGVGEDNVSVDGVLFVHGQMGGSAWRWMNGRTLSLDPLQLVSESASYGMHPAWHNIVWRWGDFAGTWGRDLPRCGAEEGETVSLGGPLVPSLDEAPAPFGSVGLGTCALAIDSREGPITHGRPGEAGDARMRVLRVGNELWVEVDDDHWVPSAPSWLHADHLELWTAPVATPRCLAPSPAVQWGIRIDGQVDAAHGEAGPLAVQVAATGEGRMWRITLPQGTGPFAVVYSDSDEGTDQERLIATAALRFGDGSTLGESFRIDPSKASCVPRDGVLVPVRTPIATPALSGAD